MDLNKAIEFAQLVNAAYGIPPENLASSAGTVITASVTGAPSASSALSLSCFNTAAEISGGENVRSPNYS